MGSGRFAASPVNAMKPNSVIKNTAIHALIGALVGIVILHPVNGMVSWFGHGELANNVPGIWHFLAESLSRVFSASMLPMTGIFALTGAAIGVGFGLFDARVLARNRRPGFVKKELARDLTTVIALGEGEDVEFKSTLRWDREQNCFNRALAATVAKTITGFMNHRGGNLLIGVADNGEILGLQEDFATLKHRNRDGFERSLMDLVKTRLGGDKCSSMHCVFYKTNGKDICRVIVESSAKAVYCHDGKVPKYYVRTGNGTRELNIQEALAHIAARQA